MTRSLRRYGAGLGALAAAGLTLGIASSAHATTPPGDDAAPAAGALDCATIAASDDAPPEITTFLSLVEQSNGVFFNQTDGPGTVLIPVESAFEVIPENVLASITADPALITSIIDYHYLPGEPLTGAELVERGEVSTAVEGTSLTFADVDGAVTVNDGAATVLCADIAQGDVTVHLIDAVLQPEGAAGGPGGSSVPGSSTPGSSTPGGSVPTSAAPFSADEQAVATAWETVTDSSLGYDDVAEYLEDPEAITETIENYPTAADAVGGITAEVRSVAIDGDDAAITYVLFFDGVEAPYGELDAEVTLVDDEWLVPNEAYCTFQEQARNPCPPADDATTANDATTVGDDTTVAETTAA